MSFDTDTYIAATAREGAAVGAVAAAGDLDAPVPSCPRWPLQKLIGHLGWVYNWVSEHIERRSATVLDRDAFPRPPAGEAVIDWYGAAHARVLEALEGIDPAEAVWSWAGINTGAFWHRRLAQESLIHRWDAENAVGEPGPLDSDLAADGVDELVEVILPFGARSAQGPLPEGTLHLHRTDGHGEWLCRVAEGRMEVERVHGRGDVALRGTGEQLDLVLWRRIEPDDVEVFGDLGVLAAWTALGR
ncbi:MAG: maleylpyruvate isomerase family mycothiol-dependent enzyme [Acidimicrobiia bacterium]|nr:maleylpyruvate isomerase family mycothiol-dependent enzyme [Acidimicrobiia bacterium]MYJ14129.1 maleylpyruvate isomerase family mycothiol-dependent enzyme [Acidimicrobiia bacterium]